jgi:ADP-heptose:LPS heptosyltransferase
MKTILKILLIMECCGAGDMISSLPAIASLSKTDNVTVMARKYYSGMFRDVAFLQAAGQDEMLKPRFDKSYWLAEWSSREEIRLGYMPKSRMEQFAEMIKTELPEHFDYVEYLAPRKIESEPYLVFCGSAVEKFRSLPEAKERELYERLSARMETVWLPRVNIYRDKIQPFNSEHHFVAGNLKELTNLIYNAKAVVSVDSGPLNLACALGVPAVGIFGVTGPETMEQYARYSDLKFIGVQGEPVKCKLPCYRNYDNGFQQCESRGSARCMDGMSIPKILEAVNQLC